MKLFSSGYFRPQYFNASFLSSKEELTRSGYWRLFYYQLQEKELKSRETPPLGIQKKVQVKLSGKPRKVARRVIPDEDPSDLPATPIYRPEILQFDPEPWLVQVWKITQEVRALATPVRGRIHVPEKVPENVNKLRLYLLLGD